jgi:hypothetical protein
MIKAAPCMERLRVGMAADSAGFFQLFRIFLASEGVRSALACHQLRFTVLWETNLARRSMSALNADWRLIGSSSLCSARNLLPLALAPVRN